MSASLDEIRKRDAESAPTWFNGPPKDSAAARAIQDRRALLQHMDKTHDRVREVLQHLSDWQDLTEMHHPAHADETQKVWAEARGLLQTMYLED